MPSNPQSAHVGDRVHTNTLTRYQVLPTLENRNFGVKDSGQRSVFLDEIISKIKGVGERD